MVGVGPNNQLLNHLVSFSFTCCTALWMVSNTRNCLWKDESWDDLHTGEMMHPLWINTYAVVYFIPHYRIGVHHLSSVKIILTFNYSFLYCWPFIVLYNGWNWRTYRAQWGSTIMHAIALVKRHVSGWIDIFHNNFLEGFTEAILELGYAYPVLSNCIKEMWGSMIPTICMINKTSYACVTTWLI